MRARGGGISLGNSSGSERIVERLNETLLDPDIDNDWPDMAPEQIEDNAHAE